jgi:hypothetical protein
MFCVVLMTTGTTISASARTPAKAEKPLNGATTTA